MHQVDIVNAYRMKKIIFSAWKSCTTFIETPTHSTMYYFKLETTARFMRKRRIFHAWRKVALSEQEELQRLAETWPSKVTSRYLQYWLVLSRSNWRQRGNLIMRFFRQIRYVQYMLLCKDYHHFKRFTTYLHELKQLLIQQPSNILYRHYIFATTNHY